MRVLRHTRFANGHVEYEAIDERSKGGRAPQREQVIEMFKLDESLTEITLTKATGTITTYTFVEGTNDNDEKGA